jgi:probable F420-dependent oxidoreductase
MEYGLHLGTRGAAADPDNLVAIARHAEGLGFRHLGLSDHIVIARAIDSRYPYNDTGVWPASESGICLEQLTTLAYVAAATNNLRLLTSVMVLPYRPAILTAKMLATVDHLSKGRLTVGVGVGWMAEEMALLGSPAYADRGRASDEYIEAFQNLWTEALPAQSGEHVAFDGLLFAPKPAQRPHPPIWIGGEGRAARRRAGRLGDGWYPVGRNPRAYLDTPELFADGLAEVRAEAEGAGRDPSALDVAMFVPWLSTGAAGEARDGGRLRFTGSKEDVAEDIGAYAAAGLRHLVIGFESDDLQETLDRVQAFADDFMGGTA